MLVFWDIDGTLLTTDRAGIYAWEAALREVVRVSADLRGFETAGHPDFGIARRLLTAVAGVPEPQEDLVRALVTRYEDRLPDMLPQRAGRVLPNVREILEALAREPRACSMLLTGNTRRGAAAKLGYFSLAPYFHGGGFSEGNGDRAGIARAAWRAAASAGRTEGPESTYVVGDTPHDIRCGHAIAARTIAVATGSYAPDALAAESPWRVLAQLPPAAEFLELVGGSASPSTR